VVPETAEEIVELAFIYVIDAEFEDHVGGFSGGDFFFFGGGPRRGRKKCRGREQL
jgi:hypothetical protein